MRTDRIVLVFATALAFVACGSEGERAPRDAAPADAGPLGGPAAEAAETPAQPGDADATAGAETTHTRAADSLTTDSSRGPSAATGTAAGRPAPLDTTTPAAEPERAEAADAQDDGARILRAASAAYDNVRSLEAEFTMRHENPILRSTTVSRGTLFQRRPDRILLRFSEPEGDMIVSDGTYFWVYYPSVDAEQVMRAPASVAGSGGVDLQAQFVGDPVERFRYTLDGRESVDGRTAHVLTLAPKTDMGYTRLKVWVDTSDSLVRRFEITEHNETVRRFDLDGLRVNPTLDDDLFRFTPPPGAQVIERG